MKKELKKEEIYFLARVRKIEVEHLETMKYLLDPKAVRSLLIRREYKERIRDSKAESVNISKRILVTMLMAKYKVSRSYIESILYAPKARRRVKSCVICGEETSYYRWSKYDGLCKKCVDNQWVQSYDD